MSNNQLSNNNKRLFTRLNFESKMQLFSGTAAYTCDIIDISLKGVLFSKPHNWTGKCKNNFRLTISIPSTSNIGMSVEIMHVLEDRIGAKWNKIDVGSFSILKRLLELNTLEKRLIYNELAIL